MAKKTTTATAKKTKAVVPTKAPPMRGRGRPPSNHAALLTEEMMEAMALRLTQEQIGATVGLSRRQVQMALKQNPKLQEAYDRGYAKTIGEIATGLVADALKGNLQARIFVLKTKGGWSERSTHEIVGKDDAPIEARIVNAKASLFGKLFKDK